MVATEDLSEQVCPFDALRTSPNNGDLYPSDDQQPSGFDVLMPRCVYHSDLASWNMVAQQIAVYDALTLWPYLP